MKRTYFKSVILLVAMASQSLICHAAIQDQRIEYKQGDAVLEGFLAYDNASENKRPGVIVVHEWKGLGPYAERRARQLAELGYVAFAVDMYGLGVRPETHEEAGKIAGIYKKDRNLMRERVKAGLEVLKAHPLVAEGKIAAIGYCFGGTTVLELARSGADVRGVVSFHGGLDTPDPRDAKNIKCKVLALHGADDPFISKEQLEAFKNEMRDAGVNWHLESYPGAVHAFTVAEAGNDPSKGAAYNAEADTKSWEAMKEFLAEIFQ